MNNYTSTLVELCLQSHPASRSSDKELIIQVLQAKGAGLTSKQMELLRSVSFESITRCRRKFQEEGKYRANKTVEYERRFKSYQVQQRITGTKPADVETLIDNTHINDVDTLYVSTKKEQARLQHIYPNITIILKGADNETIEISETLNLF